MPGWDSLKKVKEGCVELFTLWKEAGEVINYKL